MEHVVKDLQAVKEALKKRTNEIDSKKIKKRKRSELIIGIIEDALSKIHCKYVINLTKSIITQNKSDTELQQKFTSLLDLLETTKRIVTKEEQEIMTDPFTTEYLETVITRLGYKKV